MTKKKKILIACISVFAAIIIAVTITLCVLFAPRSLKFIVPQKGITKITYEYETYLGDKVEYTINEQEQEQLKSIISKAKYTLQRSRIKKTYRDHVIIYYENGDLIKLDPLAIKNKEDVFIIMVDENKFANELFKFLPRKDLPDYYPPNLSSVN